MKWFTRLYHRLPWVRRRCEALEALKQSQDWSNIDPITTRLDRVQYENHIAPQLAEAFKLSQGRHRHS